MAGFTIKNNPFAAHGFVYAKRIGILLLGFVLIGFLTFPLYALYYFFFELKSARAIGDIATSKIASAAQGYTEINGYSVPNGLESPFSQTRCVWYSYKVYGRDESIKSSIISFFKLLPFIYLYAALTDGKGKTSTSLFRMFRPWAVVEESQSDLNFQIRSGEAICEVNPSGAQASGLEFIQTYDDDYKYEEFVLLPNRSVYVLGDFKTQREASDKQTITNKAFALINDWKQDDAKFKQDFDLNNDGIVDQNEFLIVRSRATKEAKAAIENSKPINTISQPHEKRPFIFSQHTQTKLVKRYKWHAAFYALLFVVSLAYLASKPSARMHGLFNILMASHERSSHTGSIKVSNDYPKGWPKLQQPFFAKWSTECPNLAGTYVITDNIEPLKVSFFAQRNSLRISTDFDEPVTKGNGSRSATVPWDTLIIGGDVKKALDITLMRDVSLDAKRNFSDTPVPSIKKYQRKYKHSYWCDESWVRDLDEYNGHTMYFAKDEKGNLVAKSVSTITNGVEWHYWQLRY